MAAEWQLDNIEPAPPAVGLGSSQPPRWPCVCVLATETLLALRLFCGDWVMVKQLHSTSSGVGWRTTARAWSPALQWPVNQPYRVPLTAFRVTGSCAPVLPVYEGVSGQPLAVVVPVAGRCVPARGVSFLVEPCSTCDAVSFVGQIGFRKHVHHMLSGFVVAVGCGYRLAYLGSFLRLTVTDVTADSVKGNQCSDDSGVASSPITKQLSSLSLADGGGDESSSVFGIISDDTDLKITSRDGANRESTVPPPASIPVQMFGVDAVLTHMKRMVQCAAMAYSQATKAQSTRITSTAVSPLLAPSGVLVFGISGTGKSTLGAWLAARYSFVSLRCSQLASAGEAVGSEQLNERLQLVLIGARDRLRQSGVCVVFVDDLDAVAPASSSSGGGERRAHCLVAVLSFVDAVCAHTGLALVATAVRPEDVNALLRRSGRLDCELELEPPNCLARQQMLTQLLASNKSAAVSDAQLCELANLAHGFVGADLKAALLAASVSCGCTGEECVCSDSSCDRDTFLRRLAVAMRRVRPSALRQLVVEVPHVRWTDIAGQHELKLRLQQAVEWPLKHADAFRRLGIHAPRGLLMYGPPGCSKTMIARALATESRLNFVAVKGCELFSKWVGESERAVRSLFERARHAAPSVIFIDELDAVATRRVEAGSSSGGGGHSVAERVLAQLLTEMDGVGVSRGDAGDLLQRHVMVVAATNRPDLLDPALLRPGRLDSLIHVPLPDLDTRRQLLVLRLSRVPLDASVDCDWLAGRTEGYSGAEVVAVCQEAGLRALRRAGHEASVTHVDFCDALDTVLPRVTEYHRVYEEFHNRRR